MEKGEFDAVVKDALKEVPQEFLKKLENLTIFVDDYPTREQLVQVGMGQRFLLGLYEGVPQTKRGSYGIGPTVPDRITLFRVPILSIAKDRSHAVDIVKGTLIHEIAHHFGMDEEMVKKAERARKLRRKV